MKNEFSPPNLSTEEAAGIAADAYVYGFPLVLMDITRCSMTTPPNAFLHFRTFPDPGLTEILSPNADTLYSIAWVDVSKEPVILSLPDTTRYYVMPMLDAWTNVFASLGTRTTGAKRGDFAITGPDWRGALPEGLQPILSPTRVFLLMGRTQTIGANDYSTVHAIQDQYRLTPLNSWNREAPYATPAPSLDASIDCTTRPLQQVTSMDADAFFSRLNTLMRVNPPAVHDCAALERFAAIGVSPGKSFDLAERDRAEADGILKGVKNAKDKIRYQSEKPIGRNINGWNIITEHLGKFGADYNTRAAVASIGLGRNLPEDAVYPRTMIDTQGRPLSGRHKYELHFPKDRLPPVRGFWSITAYSPQHSFIPNAIDRYAVGDRDHLKFEKDGSLSIYISQDSPGPEKESNWLPVGADAFSLVTRLYWPKPEVINGMWRIPGVRRLST